jgi:hypothetical protein
MARRLPTAFGRPPGRRSRASAPMQLEAAKILGHGLIRRTAQEGCERPHVPDIVVARLLDETAHCHVFDHAPAQRADGRLTHRGAPVLRWRLLDPSILKTSREYSGLANSGRYQERGRQPVEQIREIRSSAYRGEQLWSVAQYRPDARAESTCEHEDIEKLQAASMRR